MEQDAVPALVLDRVSKRFGRHDAVAGLSLTVGAGEVIALLGPNGAGKSTTLSMVLGFVRPDSGSIRVAGFTVPGAAWQARARVGYIPEQVRLYPTLTGLENLAYFVALGGEPTEPAQLRRALCDAGLAPEAHDRRAESYSKGMRQRVAIAIAMQRRCRLLLLDEPTSGLDASASSEFHALLRRTAATGVGILMATHDIVRAHGISDRVALLREGRLLAVLDRAAFADADLEQTYLRLMREAG